MTPTEDDHSDAESFKSAQDEVNDLPGSAAAESEKHFSPEDEAKFLNESNTHKTTANAFFSKASYTDAITTYDKALASCPTYLDYEIAVLRANIAACYLKLEEWKTAMDNASLAIESLDRLDSEVGLPSKPAKDGTPAVTEAADDDNRVQEVDEEQAARIERLEKSGRGLAEVRRLRVKALLRRARARASLAKWADLAGAEEDYTALLAAPLADVLGPMDRRTVEAGLREVRPQLAQAKEAEMAEMMGKLKDMGNGVLGLFGLSTDNFKFEKGEGGGYSMQFDQNAGKRGSS
ncbi:hypothetical protein FH972_022416 [Carpinus fangiana]|uniref:Tetratricopeptide repeat protein 1 n=1 Tax=Carpinus fangiana TaxID=176857 RepID=A0A5N6KS74_9ROSI|nr:hypothetical protein FH972_022416 [Carpinus fangiana]